STAGLTTHTVTTADIQAIGATSDRWVYDRETTVGGTLAVRNPVTNAERWALPVPRAPGHQIQQVRVDGQTQTFRHDTAGEIRIDGNLQYSFDPRGQLGAVLKNGQVVESYLYDGLGRLAAVMGSPSGRVDQTFAYDGLQLVAAFGPGNKPIWEAGW